MEPARRRGAVSARCAAIATVVLASATASAFAGSWDVCSSVQSIQESLTDGQHARELLKQLRLTDDDIRSGGCNGSAAVATEPRSPRCPALAFHAIVLRRFLAAHNSAWLAYGDNAIAGLRTVLRLAVDEFGCNGLPTESRVFGGGRWEGNYRTLCVRQCDGYFFPVSWATSAANFRRDELVCRSKYPPGEAELYLQPNPSANDESGIVSLAGESYATKPFAFSFRRSFDRSCAGLFRPRVSVGKPAAEKHRPDAAAAFRSDAIASASPAPLRDGARQVRIVGSSDYEQTPESPMFPPPEMAAKPRRE